MLTLECHVSLANRSDKGVRDLVLSGALICAQRSAQESAAIELSQVQRVERIGPQQSRALSFDLQLPISDVQPIRQGQTPVFIPMAEIALEGQTITATKRSYVVGTPSASWAGRLHPIALNTPPGRIEGLRTRLVKQDSANDKAA